MQKKRILITGVSGLLGSNLAYYFRNSYEVYGIYHEHPVVIAGVKTSALDVLDARGYEQFVLSYRPDIVVHCAALANIDLCEEDHQRAFRMNVTATENVVRPFPGLNPKYIFISTDAVYEGLKGNYAEDDPLVAINYYAETKIKAEEVVQSQVASGLIVRTSFYGWNLLPGKLSLAQWVIDQLSQHKPIKGFTNVISSNMYVQDFCKVLHAMIERDLQGVFNLGCAKGISKFDFACAIAKRFNYSLDLIGPFDVDDFKFKARRGKDLSFNVARIEQALGQVMPNAQTCIEHFDQDQQMWDHV